MHKKNAACLNAYIDKSLSDRLADYCKRTGRTKTIVIGWALEKYLNDHMEEALACEAGQEGGRSDG